MVSFRAGRNVVEEAIRKANVLLEALGWIRQFRGRYVVIKLGGSALEETGAVQSFLTDVLFLETVGMKPILIHGGGKAISQAMNAAGLEPRFVHGRRYTDERTLDIVARVLVEDICGSLVSEIERQGGRAAALHYGTRNVLVGETLALRGEDGAPIDLGAVGSVVDLDRHVIDEVCRSATIPVIPSVALNGDGRKLNVNADTAAAAVARLLRAEKLVFLSDVPGILLDREDPTSLVAHLESARCRELIANGTIEKGMVPKVDAALEALEAGVRKVHIVDAGMPHSVLLEIYSNRGVGTEIVP
jgi:acetylglutamate kinase